MRRYSFIKLISVALVLCMALSALAGCNSGDPENSTPVTTPLITPEATTPGATTPEVTTPEATTPEATTPDAFAPADTTPVETPPATQPLVSYNISYDLDGGIDGGNPATYNKESEFSLVAPLRAGYVFAGWTGTGLSAPTLSVKVEKGTEGDLAYKATWTELEWQVNVPADTSFFGGDNGLTPNPEDITDKQPDSIGFSGEGIYTLKTVYTDISVDGTMDPAYTYGLYVKSDLLNGASYEYYKKNDVSFEAYLIRGQNGKLYVYAEIVDPTIIVNAQIFNDKAWHVDGLDFYYDYGNHRSGTAMYSFVADPTETFKRTMPAERKIVLTEKGYAVEFAMDNGGGPFLNGDQLGFQLYLNDTFEWNPTTNGRTKGLLTHSTELAPVSGGYHFPEKSLYDAIRMSVESATGKVNVGTSNQKTGDMITDILNGSASVAFIYDKNAAAKTILSAEEIADFISLGGGNVKIIREDYLTDKMSFDYKMYFGMTDNERSLALIDSLKYVDYGIAVYEDSLVFVGWLEKAADASLDLLKSLFTYVQGGGKTSDLVGGVYTGTVADRIGADVPRLDGFDSISDVGEGAFQVYKLEATLEEYEAYCAALVESGYTLYTTNTMNKVLCATYYNDEIVASVQYANGGEKTEENPTPINHLRVIFEPADNTALPSLEKPEDADSNVTVTSISMLDHQIIGDGNLCLVIQLSNGHFIIVDSNCNGTQKGISDFLRKKAPDGKPIVDAWFMTHFHQDHTGGFVDYMSISSLSRYVTVKNVIYNFPSEQVFLTAKHSTTDMNNMRTWYSKLKPSMQEKGTTFYQARTGQKYYFGNAEIEILWTFEDIMPHNVFKDRSNPTCIGFSIEIAGQKIMVTGDSSVEEFDIAAKKYGDYLKSDIVQLSHHGYGDGSLDHKFYQYVNAPYVLNSGMGLSYGSNERWAMENAEVYILRDDVGTCTLTLPYLGGKYESEKGQ